MSCNQGPGTCDRLEALHHRGVKPCCAKYPKKPSVGGGQAAQELQGVSVRVPKAVPWGLGCRQKPGMCNGPVFPWNLTVPKGRELGVLSKLGGSWLGWHLWWVLWGPGERGLSNQTASGKERWANMTFQLTPGQMFRASPQCHRVWGPGDRKHGLGWHGTGHMRSDLPAPLTFRGMPVCAPRTHVLDAYLGNMTQTSLGSCHGGHHGAHGQTPHVITQQIQEECEMEMCGAGAHHTAGWKQTCHHLHGHTFV